MNRPHPPAAAHSRSADRMATARWARRSGRRAARTIVVVLLLVAWAARPAVAGCPGGDGHDGELACPGGTPVGTATADSPTPASTAASLPVASAGPSDATRDEGQRELAIAKKLLDEGEQARDADARKRAYEEAKRHADRAVELRPNDADAHFVQFAAEGRIAQLGGIAVAALQLVKLNNQLDEVLRLDPNHANALAARGGMLMKLPRLFGGDTAKGVQYLERAVALDTTAVGKRLELAEAYHIVGREDDAQATAQSALEVAKQLNQPDRVATCERFIVELGKTCSGCAVASIGR